MRAEERQNYILNTARESGFVSIIDTAKNLDVSTETIRRDIQKLCEKELLKKIRGGASPIGSKFAKDGDYWYRTRHGRNEKASIAAEAAKMIESNMIVAISSGTTPQLIANYITDVKNVTFVTNSIPVAMALLKRIDTGEISGQVIISGGKIDSENLITTSDTALEEIDHFNFNLAFVSCTAMSANGASSFYIHGIPFVRHIMKQSLSSVLVVESAKMGKVSTYTYAKLTDFDTIITDNKNSVPKDIAESISNSKTKITIAECNNN